ncbi:MAG TPA: hypothetical protein VM791_20415 [Vicinamibacterales bacterium]|jgi:hypothetical protein|nr:hypothetical protein [Vicinamibacterales bacterium]
MERQKLEVLEGVGEIYAGDRLLRTTTYHIEVSTQRSPPISSDETVVEGTIDINGMPEAVVLAGADDLTLRLEDGRTVPFTLGSTLGRIRIQGGLPPSPGDSSRSRPAGC